MGTDDPKVLGLGVEPKLVKTAARKALAVEQFAALGGVAGGVKDMFFSIKIDVCSAAFDAFGFEINRALGMDGGQLQARGLLGCRRGGRRGGEKDGLAFAWIEHGGEDLILILQPACLGWRVAGIDR